MRETGRDESQSVPSPEKLFKSRDLELPIFEGTLPSCSPHSAGYTRTSVNPYFPVAKPRELIRKSAIAVFQFTLASQQRNQHKRQGLAQERGMLDFRVSLMTSASKLDNFTKTNLMLAKTFGCWRVHLGTLGPKWLNESEMSSRASRP